MGLMPSFDSRPVLFNYSYIQWTTNAESSSGNFQIDSVLDYLNTASNQSAQFVAPKPVPAGRMYANCDTSLKMPSYNYHLIGSKKNILYCVGLIYQAQTESPSTVRGITQTHFRASHGIYDTHHSSLKSAHLICHH